MYEYSSEPNTLGTNPRVCTSPKEKKTGGCSVAMGSCRLPCSEAVTADLETKEMQFVGAEREQPRSMARGRVRLFQSRRDTRRPEAVVGVSSRSLWSKQR